MTIPDYRLIGTPARFTNGRGVRAARFHQKFRLLADPACKVRTVSLKTTDLTTARRRAVKFVEARVRQDLLARDPQARTLAIGISAALKEYLDHLTATGNSAKQVAMEAVRLSSEALLARYTKIPQAAIADLVEAVPVPRLPLKIVG
jgi:hypothetical protein